MRSKEIIMIKLFEIPGGILVEYDNDNLEEKINEKTCAIAYVIAPFFDEGLGLSETIEIAHKNKLPLLLDAAAELPPRENLTKFISMGVDAVGLVEKGHRRTSINGDTNRKKGIN